MHIMVVPIMKRYEWRVHHNETFGVCSCAVTDLVADCAGIRDCICSTGTSGSEIPGSRTSANVLFGGLQVETAGSLGLDPCWLAGANTVGATIGKMISPQSIAIGTAATATVGSESKILRKVIKYCAIFIIIAGCVAYAGSRMR